MKSIRRKTKSEAQPAVRRPGRVPSKRDAHLEVLDRDLEPGARDVRDRLLAHGASPEFTAVVVRSVLRSGASGAYAIDTAAKAIGAAFRILPSPRRRKKAKSGSAPHVLVFVGPTGAGKTTTLAKLGRRLMEAGRSVLFASMDAAGTSALARGLESDVDRAELPLVGVRGASDLAKELKRRSGTDVVLLDTPGLSPRDEAGLDDLVREIDRVGSAGPLDVYLVLPATRSRRAIDLVVAGFQRTAPAGCVLTKLDETDEPFTVLEEVGRRNLPLAFLAQGMDTRTGIERPTPGRLADLALRGRLA